MSEKKIREDVSPGGVISSSNVHIRGYYGDTGENEGVLSVVARRDMTPNDVEHGAIVIGSPEQSPLMPGYIPNLGGFLCSVEAAELLVEEIKKAIEIVRAGRR